MSDYRMSQSSDSSHPCHDYNNIHRQQGLKNVVQIY